MKDKLNRNISNFSAFAKVVHCNFCFRECATLVHIAAENNCKITLANGSKRGDTSSVLSLMKLGIHIDTPVIFTITGDNQSKTYHQIMELFNNGWQ